MKQAIFASAFALASAGGWTTPAHAQDADAAAIQQELAQMREQMAAMAQRIDSLQAQLAQTQAAADTAQTTATEAAAVAAATKGADNGIEVAWKGAPEISSEGGWSFKPRGRLQYDAGFTNAPEATGRADGFGNEVRRARLGVEGDIPGGFGYKFEMDFANNEVEVADAYLAYGDGPLGVIIGHHNNFQSLEELTSSLHTSFIERAAFTDAFGFERRIGVSASYASGIVLAQAGLFTDNFDETASKNRGADARVMVMPKMGSAQLHLGASVHYNDIDDPAATVRYRQRPLVHFTSERFVDTRSFGATSELGYGVEAAAISGPFHAAGEGYWQRANRPGALAEATFFGGYAEAGMFLTRGDTRGYKGGKFDRIKPKNPVGDGGFGAVQVNLRYDYLDLNDAGIVGGIQNGYQASLIWTPTAYTRFLVNYGRMSYDDAIYALPGGDRSYSVDAFGVRAQVDF